MSKKKFSWQTSATIRWQVFLESFLSLPEMKIQYFCTKNKLCVKSISTDGRHKCLGTTYRFKLIHDLSMLCVTVFFFRSVSHSDPPPSQEASRKLQLAVSLSMDGPISGQRRGESAIVEFQCCVLVFNIQ